MFEKSHQFLVSRTSPKTVVAKDEELDATIAKRFAGLHKQASAGELFAWRDNAEGALAEVIVLDQFSRNIYRDTPQAFACDNLALALAQYAVEKRFDNELTAKQRSFLYMPFMHSESQLIHQEALKLYTALGNENNLKFEQQHKAIIDRFGRYPHRNKILGRASTLEEIEFLTQPNSSF